MADYGRSKPFDKTNTFTIGKNTRKREGKEGEKDPTLSGTINIDGVEYWLNGWTRESENGKFISGTIKPKEPRRSGPGPSPSERHDRPQDGGSYGRGGQESRDAGRGYGDAAKPKSKYGDKALDDEIPFVWLMPVIAAGVAALSLLTGTGIA